MVLALVMFILLIARKGDFDTGITSAFGRANPRVQIRCKPYFNGRLAGSPAKAIKKLEHGKFKIKVRKSAFHSFWYPLPIPKQFKQHYEYPETEHKEGLIVVQEFQADVRSDDPIWDFYKDSIYNTANELAVAKKQLATIKDQVDSGASKNYVLASINSLIPTIERLHAATERKKDELPTLIVEQPPTAKAIEKPTTPSTGRT